MIVWPTYCLQTGDVPTTDNPCKPCQQPPPPPPPPPGGGTLPPYTDSHVNIRELEVFDGDLVNASLIGSAIIYSAGYHVQGVADVIAFGTPLNSPGHVIEVIFESNFSIDHPWYPAGSYDGTMPNISAGQSLNGIVDQAGVGAAEQAALEQAASYVGI